MRHLTSIPLFLANTAYLIALIVLGTLAQKGLDNADAVITHYFANPILWLGPVPLPGVPCSLALMAISITLKLAQQPLTRLTIPTFLSHLGVILLILSGLVLTLTQRSGYVLATTGQPTQLWQAQPTDPLTPPSAWPALGLLPFSVTLQQFTKVTHPGTTIPASYSSQLTFGHGPQAIRHTISMNQPFRIHGYTFYQASYFEAKDAPTISVLAVQHSPFRLLPYLATAVLTLGLAWRLLQRLPKLVLTTAIVSLTPFIASANATPIATLSVQHEGRTKPLIAAAHSLMPTLTGQRGSATHSLTQLQQLLFHPTTFTSAHTFKVNSNLQTKLHLPASPNDSYPLAQVLAAFQTHGLPTLLAPSTPQGLRTQLQTLADRLANTLQLARTFALWRPTLSLTEPLAKALNLPIGTHSAATILAHRSTLQQLASTLPQQPPQLQTQLLTLTAQLRTLQPQAPNTLLTLIPPTAGSIIWLTPWQLTQQTTPLTPTQTTAVTVWQSLLAGTPTTLPTAPLLIQLEALITQYPPITLALIPLTLLLLATTHPLTRRFIYPLGMAAHLLLVFALTARCFILARPPVATLYESVIFVASTLLLLGLTLHRPRQPFLPLTAALALTLCCISFFLHHGADSMGMLAAVLNTRLWLAVHVLTITGGYALSLLTGAVGLYSLTQRSPHPSLPPLVLASLLLTGIGTLLGGVWADQSWGRFWGWDPKENGALVLTLALSAIAHLPYHFQASPRPYLATISLLPSVVALSWFGVNLLGTGLHSYGFTTGLTGALAAFCTLNLLTTIVLTHRHATRPR